MIRKCSTDHTGTIHVNAFVGAKTHTYSHCRQETSHALTQHVPQTLTDYTVKPNILIRIYTYIHIAYSTVGTQPPPHDYVPHAKIFSNKSKNYDMH